jgi:hypothetical protein
MTTLAKISCKYARNALSIECLVGQHRPESQAYDRDWHTGDFVTLARQKNKPYEIS